MKKTLLLYLVLLFIAISCDNGSVDPPQPVQRNFIDLPVDPALGDTTKFDSYYMMHGSYGTTIQFDRQFLGGPFGQYGISATLTIQTGTIAATDSLLCLLEVFLRNTCVHVSPLEQYFAHPFKLTLKYSGLNLQNLDLSNLEFTYTNENDVAIAVSYDSIIIDYVTGTIEVVNAIIQYDPKQVADGKYGWVRKAE